MPYEVRVAPQVVRALRKENDRDLVRRLVRAMDALGTTPRPRGVRKLAGEEDLWRIRVGDYRIIYTIDDGKLVVLVIALGNRRDVYR